ncbi:MAG TPA: glycosyltransferase family 39 protein [Solirubrobacteraceae bacterium]|nr:glycosyltransferase family 39 protein [Solirubrobacteraceae bacterium]
MESLKSRWQALDRDARIALVGLVALVGMAVGVRAWLMGSYPPAFLGFPDSYQYAFAAAKGIFSNTQHPAGYPFFLRLVHHLSNTLSFTIAVQHVIGVATGVLLYMSVRRTGAPPWLGLIPAAIVFFGGTGLILEHSLLSDPLLAFLQAVGVYFAIRALYDRSIRWPLLAGIAIGLSFWVRTVAISSAILIPIVLLCAAPGGARRRALSALTASLAIVALIIAYVGFQDYFTGYLGYERQGAWNLYARVATFVNCSDFTPPSGTRFLCPPEPPGHRREQNYYQYASTAPAVKRLGLPFVAPAYANALLQKFSIAAIEHQPVAYIEAIIRGLGFYVFPRLGEGYTPQSLSAEMMSPAQAQAFQAGFTLLYAESLGYTHSTALQPLLAYEKYTLVQGPLLIILLVAAIAGPFFLPRRMRWAAAIFTLTALFSITFAVAGDSYDARFAYVTFGPLAAGAALGAWGIGLFLARTIRQRRRPAGSPEVEVRSGPRLP